MKNRLAFALSLPLLLPLAACGGVSDSGGGSGTGLTRAEQYCRSDQLAPALRQSFVLIDAKSLSKSATAEEFLSKNVHIRDLTLAIADPEKALASGMAAPRERFSIFVVPADGTAARMIFTGCIPGLTPAEQQKTQASSSKASEFFSGDPLEQVTKDGNLFREQLIASLFTAAKDGVDEPSGDGGDLGKSRFVQGLMASRILIEGEGDKAKRLFLVTDLSRIEFAESESELSERARGLAAGKATGDLLRLSDVYIIQPKSKPVNGRDFVAAFVTGQGGKLVSYSSGIPSALSETPVKRWKFIGEIRYPSGPEQAEIYLSDNGKGKLASSWFVLLGGNASATPMTGTIACTDTDDCVIRSDKSGFAQAWKTSNGPEPQWDENMPLAGARDFHFQIKGDELTGEVRDDRVQLSNDPAQPGLIVKAKKS